MLKDLCIKAVLIYNHPKSSYYDPHEHRFIAVIIFLFWAPIDKDYYYARILLRHYISHDVGINYAIMQENRDGRY
jgi:hypothetical protein